MKINGLISLLKYVTSMTQNLFTSPINVYDYEDACKPEHVC